MARVGTLPVRSSERAWLQSRGASQFSKPSDPIKQIVVTCRGMKHGLVRICFDLDIVLGRQQAGDALMDEQRSSTRQEAAAATGVGKRCVRRIADPELADVTARIGNSSVTFLRRISERTRHQRELEARSGDEDVEIFHREPRFQQLAGTSSTASTRAVIDAVASSGAEEMPHGFEKLSH
jgi:hypothetical protein